MSNNIYLDHKDKLIKDTGLKIYASNIAKEDMLESIMAVPKAVITKIATITSSLADRFKVFAGIKFEHGNNAYVKQIQAIHASDVVRLSKENYAKFRELMVPTIPGLKVNFIVSSEEVTKGLTIIDNAIEPLLKQLEQYIGNVCSNEDFRTSSRPQAANQDLQDLVLKLNKGLDNCFSTKKVQDVEKYHVLYPNNSCLLPIYETLHNHGRFVSLDNMEKLKTYTKSLNGKLEALLEAMADNDYKISKPVIIKLSNDVENMAQLITTVSTYIHWYDQACVCYVRTLVELNKKA